MLILSMNTPRETERGSNSIRIRPLCSCEDCAALCRTAQLLRLDVFESDPRRDHEIVAGLRTTTALIVADSTTAATPAGQTAIVTLYAQLAMMGLQVGLDLPDLALVRPQPPLEGDRLVDGLLAYSDDLMPGGSSGICDQPEVVFAIGEAPTRGADVRVSWGNTRAVVLPGYEVPPRPVADAVPFVPIAAAAAAAAEGIRAAVPVVSERLGVDRPRRPAWLKHGSRRISVDLGALVTGIDTRLGDVDAISGGAITQAALYCLLRVPSVAGRVRVIDRDRLDASNMNRYGLARRSQFGLAKSDILSSFSGDQLEISGLVTRLDVAEVQALRPFAPSVVVGVDHIPSRWLVQRECSESRICVGATSHDFVLVSEHRPGTPCAACSHPVDDATAGPLPTISFASLWAGLIQAALLLSGEVRSIAWAAELWPLGLHGIRGFRPYEPGATARCPIQCSASHSVRSRAG